MSELPKIEDSPVVVIWDYDGQCIRKMPFAASLKENIQLFKENKCPGTRTVVIGVFHNDRQADIFTEGCGKYLYDTHMCKTCTNKKRDTKGGNNPYKKDCFDKIDGVCAEDDKTDTDKIVVFCKNHSIKVDLNKPKSTVKRRRPAIASKRSVTKRSHI